MHVSTARAFFVFSILSVAFAFTGCGGTPGTKPDDMSVEEHQKMAKAEAEKARAHGAKHDPNAVQVRRAGSVGRVGGVELGDSVDIDWEEYNPTEWHGNEEEKHIKHAQDHLRAAEVLERFESAQCTALAPKIRTFCPLMGPVIKVEDIEGGARFTFKPKVNMEKITAHVKCHLAYGRAHGHTGMQHCPLYLRDLTAKRNGQQLDLTTSNAADVATLRQKAYDHVGQ